MSDSDIDCEYCIVMTTTATNKHASALARKIVMAKLAACVQIQRIESHYIWEEQAHQDAEYLLLAKTRTKLFEELSRCIGEDHPYENPEVVAIPVIRGSASYLSWIDKRTDQ